MRSSMTALGKRFINVGSFPLSLFCLANKPLGPSVKQATVPGRGGGW